MSVCRLRDRGYTQAHTRARARALAYTLTHLFVKSIIADERDRCLEFFSRTPTVSTSNLPADRGRWKTARCKCGFFEENRTAFSAARPRSPLEKNARANGSSSSSPSRTGRPAGYARSIFYGHSVAGAVI